MDFSLKQWFSTRGDFSSPCTASQRILAMFGMFAGVIAEAGDAIDI